MGQKKSSFGFIVDPLESFDVYRETTLFLMAEAQRRGHRLFALTLPQLFLKGSSAQGEALEIKILGIGKKPFFKVLAKKRMALESLDVLFLRKDPPVDLLFVHHLYLLLPLKGKVFMVNDPEAILKSNEKTLALQFPQWAPRSCITASWDEMSRFAGAEKKGIVLKPMGSSGGRGIFYFKSSGDSNLRVAFEILSKNGKRLVVGQEFLPAVRKGDKRVMLLNGEILGYFNRLPKPGDHRANLHSGGRLAPCRLSSEEKKIAQEVGRVLRKEGLYFVGLDLIGERLTEINLTSPMGLNEINKTQGGRSEERVIDFVEWKMNR